VPPPTVDQSEEPESTPVYRLACAKVRRSRDDLVPKRKPRSCGLRNGANSQNARLTKMRWSSWGKTARGRGKAIPNHGRAKPVPFTITLRRPRACGGVMLYTRIKITTRHGRRYVKAARCEDL
jgi:hypothetical protein